MKCKIDLKINDRILLNSGLLKKIRKNKFVPGIIYLKNKSSLLFSSDSRDLDKIVLDPSCFTRIYNVQLDEKQLYCILKEVQFHPVNDSILHIDLMEIKEKEKVKISVPVRILNKELCPGIKLGGDVFVLNYNVNLKCIVGKIPEVIDIDVQNSNIGDKFFLSSYLPKDCQLYDDVILAKVSGKRVKVDSDDSTSKAPTEGTKSS